MPLSRDNVLKSRWNDFLKITQDDRQRKELALESFLAAFLQHAVQKTPASAEENTEISGINFGDMKSVSNLLAGELLTDVHKVCSNSDDDDTSHLQAYLLEGRGAALLKVLNTIGVDGVSCSRELGDLLATLLPLCCKFATSASYEVTEEFGPMDECFNHLSSRPTKKSITKFPMLTEVSRTVPSSTANMDLHTKWPPERPPPARRKKSSASDDSSESDEDIASHAPTSRRYRHMPSHNYGAMGRNLGVFPGILLDHPDEDGLPDPEDTAGPMKVNLDPMELSLISLDLLQCLCEGDCGELAQTRVVSFIILPHLTHLLLSLVSEVVSEENKLPDGWTPEKQLQLIRYLTRATITVLSHASLQPNGISYLSSHGCILTLIDSAKLAAKALPQLREQETRTNVDMEMLSFVDDVLYGVLKLIHSLLHNIPLNPSILSSALKVINSLCDHGLQLVQVVLVHWEHCLKSSEVKSAQYACAKNHIVSMVSCMGRVISSLKKAKVDYVHAMKCLKRKHRTCDFSNYTHHHHDILGISAAAFADYLVTMSDSYGSMEGLSSESPEITGQSECAVAILSDFLLQIFADAQTSLLHIQVLSCIDEAGLCCCMLPGRVQRYLLADLEKLTPGVRSFILCVLTKVLMDFCGGSARVQFHGQNICSVCSDVDPLHSDAIQKDLSGLRHETSDSALSSSEASLHEASKVPHPKWQCLRQFLPLLRHRNDAISIQVTQHLLRLISQASNLFKQQLFNTVFLPLLRQLKKKYLDLEPDGRDPSDDLNETVVQYVLSALPLLLHSKTSQDLFHNSGGVKLLQALIRIRALRRCVLKVFQVLVVLEEKNSQISHQQLPQGNTTRDLLTESVVREECEDGNVTIERSYANLGDEVDAGHLGSTVCTSFMDIILKNAPDYPVDCPSGDTVDSANIESGDRTPENLLPTDRHDLTIMCDVWSASAVLFPSSHQFQQNFISTDGHLKALSLLRFVLNKISNITENDTISWSPGRENSSNFQCWLAVMESTLFLCLGCCRLRAQFGSQVMNQEVLLNDIRSELERSNRLSGQCLQAVCDMLLSCAMTHRNMHDIVNNHTFAVMHLRIDDCEELEVSEVSDYCSTARESETCHTEQGYEADSEFTPDENSKLEGRLSVSRHGKISRSPTHILHYPELVKLALEILVLYPKTLAEDAVLSHVLLRLISIAKQSFHIASALYNQGIVDILLVGVKKTVDVTDSPHKAHHPVEQRLLLDLFLLISQHAFSSKELTSFLSLFKTSPCLTEALLSTATALAESFHTKPTYILVFPIFRQSFQTNFELSVRSLSSDILTASFHARTPSSEDQQSEYAHLLKTSSVQEAIDLDVGCSIDGISTTHGYSSRSPLNCAPVQMNLGDSLQWPSVDKSFSLSLWINLEETIQDPSLVRRSRNSSRVNLEVSADDGSVCPDIVLPPRLRAALSRNAACRHWSEHCLHLVSLGSAQHQVEFWLDPETANLICRRIVDPEGEERVIGELSFGAVLGLRSWEHLAINYREYLLEGNKKATVTIHVNGCYSKEVTVTLLIEKNELRPQTSGDAESENRLMVGHIISSENTINSTGSWHMGNIMLFRDVVLNQAVSFHLNTLGPNCCSISQCDSGEGTVQYARYVTHELLEKTNVNLDMFTSNQSVSLQPLREGLVMMYTPANVTTFNLYRPLLPYKQRGGQERAFSTLNHHPLPVPVRLLTDIAAQAHTGLSDAVNEIGGVGVFLHLFAWSVEQCESEKEQARALKLLFTLIGRNSHHARDFYDMGGYAMLAKVLGTERCKIGYRILKVLLDAALTRSMLRFDSSAQEYILQADTGALICDVHIIYDLLLAWRVWEQAPEEVWLTAFKAIVYLLRDDHPQHQFNIKQLHNMGLVDRLLDICLERFQEARPSMPIPICQATVQITTCMLGYPPDIHIIMTICDFLLLIHPAASAYINHTPDRFYFTQKWVKLRSSRLGSSSSSISNMSSPSLTSTPNKSDRMSDADAGSPVIDSLLSDQEGSVSGKLYRSQSLPGSAVQSPKSNRLLLLGRSQTLQHGDHRHKEALEHVSDTLELDDSIPALVVRSENEVSPSNSPPLQKLPIVGEQSSPEAPEDHHEGSVEPGSRKASLKSDVKFYVDTASDVSTSSGQSNQTEQRKKDRKSGSATDTSKTIEYVANYINDVATSQSSVHESGITRTDTSEDENGNNVLGSVQLSTSAPETSHSDVYKDEWSNVRRTDSEGSFHSVMPEVEDEMVEEEEKGLVHISVGLLELLCNVLVLLPESDLSKILGVILKPETLLVMANHNSSSIRKSIVRLLDVFFHRASTKQKDQFLRQQGFHLLASQLYQHAASRSILEACFTIIFSRPHALEDDFLSNELLDMTKIQKQAIIPVLAMLESSTTNVTICHSTLVLLIKIFEGVDCMVPTMLENALIETLCNMIAAIHSSPPKLNKAGVDERYLLIEDIQHFLAMIAERTFSTCGVAYYQHFEDSLTLLRALETCEIAKYGLHSPEVDNVRNMQAYILRAVFDYIGERLESNESKNESFQRSLSDKMGSFLSLLPGKRSMTESRIAPSKSLASARVRNKSLTTYIQRQGTRTSAPAHIAKLNQSSSSSYQSDSPASVSDWSYSSTRTPSAAAIGFQGSKKMEISQGDLLERLKKVIIIASNFVLYSVPRNANKTHLEERLSKYVEDSIEVVPVEKDFARFLLEFMLKAIVAGMERTFFQRKTLYSTIMWQAKDILRVNCSYLIAYMLSPSQALPQRLFVLDLLSSEIKITEFLKLIINIASLGQKLVFYLYELLVTHVDKISRIDRESADELMNCLQAVGITPLRIGSKISPEFRTAMDDDQSLWLTECKRERRQWLKKHDAARRRLQSRMEAFSRRISGFAMELTQTVVNAQNSERRKFVEHVKLRMSHLLGVKKSWQQLIQQLSNERAVWHCPESYPQCWQLDPTEGPCRVRRRLQRCHLSLDSRYFMKECRGKLDAEHKDPPLSYLFDEDVTSSDSAALIYRLHTNEKIQHTCRCTSVTPSSETEGELLISQSSVYFVGDEAILDANYTQVLLGNKDLLSMTLPNEDITEIHKRWYQLRDIGLEIFLTNGKTCLMAFTNTGERDQICRLLLSLELPSLIQSENLLAIQQMWLERRMTNFEYLTHLNKMAGRSFNDLMQYPVFPFILSSYDGDVLNLESSSTFRNLSKPISVQYKDREQKYVENYKWLAQEKEKFANSDPSLYVPEPYHYGSHYSNSGTVLHFLVRLPPFTQMFLEYQDKNFDLPDRAFHSMQTAWHLASYLSTTDVKELIPEFFFLPEFFLNREGFDLGVRQDNTRVCDVVLPAWCKGDHRLFVLILRQALESEYVTQHVAAWIDLVFGFKQTGKAAIEAINVFHPATYFGTDVEKISDPLRRTAIKTMIKTYGQTPKQLFKTCHPSPHPLKGPIKEKSVAMKSVVGLQWGNYVGSPDQPEPVMAWSQNHGSVIASLVALPTDDVFGLGLDSCLLVMYSKEKGVTALNTTDVLWAAIVSWNHPDGVIRIQNRRNAPPLNFIDWGIKEKVTCCASVPDCRLLFFGSTSGVVSVFNSKFNADKVSNLQMFGKKQCLYGHAGSVTAMCVCKPFSVLVTTSTDTSAIIWDLNRLCYVRTIDDHESSVQLVAVSDVSGDIATVSHTDKGSVLKLHSVNAELVASVKTSKLIHCLAFSNAPEGRSINIIAGGLSNGTIRFWSSWDLSVVRDISWDKFTKPIISLSFTHDAQRLYASDIDGTVSVFEKPKSAGAKGKPVNFTPFL